MNDLNTLLREIHARADSLATFAKHAARLDEQPDLKSEYVERAMQNLMALQCLNGDLLAFERARLVAKIGGEPANTQSYTTLDGAHVVPPIMDWLEDGYYCDEDGERLCCSRYCIGADASGDGLSVWLNDDMQEVEV